jgi:hypothetical protein
VPQAGLNTAVRSFFAAACPATAVAAGVDIPFPRIASATTTSHAIVIATANFNRLDPICIVAPFRAGMSPSSLVGVNYSFHVLPVAARTRFVDVAADREQPVGILRVDGANRRFARY